MMKQNRLIISFLLVFCSMSVVAQNRLVNLGSNINSYLHETNPVISPDGQTLYFSRSQPNDPNNTNRNIRYSTLRNNSWWSASRELPGVLNNEGWNAVAGFTTDGNTMLLVGKYMPDGTLKGGFSLSERTENGWTTPVPLDIPELPQAYETQTATMSLDGRTIIFSSNHRFGENFYGMFDLFITQKQNNGEWTVPKNLGATVNTPHYETAPFLAADGVTLYFSTNGRDGYGGNDIYVCRRQDSTWTNWSEPVNLGPEVNTRRWESYISVTASSTYAYVGSTTRVQFGHMNIYRVRLKDELKPLNDGPLAEIEDEPEEEPIEEEEIVEQPTEYEEEIDASAPQIENLGSSVNSGLSEMAPLISPDGQTLFFSRSVPYDWKNLNRNIYFATMQHNGKWGTARAMSSEINVKGWNIPCGITADGNMLLLSGSYQDDGTLRGGFSVTHRQRNGWSKPQALQIDSFPENDETQAGTLSPDGKTIIFASQKKIGDEFYGLVDLYVTFELSEGHWSQPVNLGNVVNTGGYETSPFLAADTRTLYFSTNGHGGFGSQDIFVTQRLDESWQNWSPPQNMGPEVNTTDWEAYFAVPASGKYAYVGSRNATFGMMDIFRIRLESAPKPQPTVIVSGQVRNAITNEPLTATIHYHLLTDSVQQWTAKTNPATGRYQIVLNAGQRYGFYASADNYVSLRDHLDLTAQEAYDEVTRDLLLTPVNTGQTYVLNNVFFDRGSAVLRPESHHELDRLVELLNAQPSMKIEIGGHTELHHSEPTLSEDRAKAVKAYLVSQGVDETRITAVGYANTQPLVTEGELSKNRRVEFKILEE